jgi:hypothetical protein
LQRKEERRLIREERAKRRAVRAKEEEKKAYDASSSELSSSSDDGDGDDDVSYHASKGNKTIKDKGKMKDSKDKAATPRRNMPPYPLTILICLTVTVSLSSTYPRASCHISMGQTSPSGST